MTELTGKAALITGAGSGIGKATAVRLAREGACVGVLSRTADEVHATADQLKGWGTDALPLVADLADADAVHDAVDQLARHYGRLDIVIANAGINGVWAYATGECGG